ncbi:MAG: class I SAM-dependent methyltransferase [bacterium]
MGGRALDVASGLGRGIATAGERFGRIYAVEISDVAVARARQIWGGGGRIRWILADATRLCWPDDFLGLVCAFGFTDLPFFSRARAMIAPGGMFLYEGFSARQLEVKPGLDPAWTSNQPAMRALFEGWEVLTCEEPAGPPFRLRFAAIRPTANEGST